MNRGIILAAVLAILSGCASKPANVTFHERKDDIKTITLLPINVSVSRLGFAGGASPIPEKEESMPASLHETAVTKLEEAGFTVDQLEAHQDDPEFRVAVSNTRNAVSSLLESIAQEKKNGTDEAPAVRQVDLQLTGLQPYVQSDAVALIDYAGFERSGANMAKSWFITLALVVGTGSTVVFPASGSATQLTVLDARDGALLWTDAVPGALNDYPVEKAAANLARAYNTEETDKADDDTSGSTTSTDVSIDTAQAETASLSGTPESTE
jgi:hypothetical protein